MSLFVVCSGVDASDLSKNVNMAVDSINNYRSKNCLILNQQITDLILFSLILAIPQTQVAKFLGVYLDSKLT